MDDPQETPPPPGGLDPLVEVVYDYLRRVAQTLHARRGARPSVRPTSLVHEAYERLARRPDAPWRSQAHFAATAAKAMRQILIDRARRRLTDKRGGDWEQVTLSGVGEADRDVDALELERALSELQALDARACDIVELRFFGGLTNEEIAEMLGVTTRTIERDWRAARAWLSARLGHSTQ